MFHTWFQISSDSDICRNIVSGFVVLDDPTMSPDIGADITDITDIAGIDNRCRN